MDHILPDSAHFLQGVMSQLVPAMESSCFFRTSGLWLEDIIQDLMVCDSKGLDIFRLWTYLKFIPQPSGPAPSKILTTHPIH